MGTRISPMETALEPKVLVGFAGLPFRARAWLASVVAAIYLGGVFSFYRLMGPRVCALVGIPVAAVGWVWGPRVGLLVGALSFPLDMLLCGLAGEFDWHAIFLSEGMLGIVATHALAIAIGGLMGWVHDLREHLADASTRFARASQALRESEEKYHLLTENQKDLLVKFDPKGILSFVSPSFCDMFGQTEEELLGSTFRPLVHEQDREITTRALEDLQKEPYSCCFAHRLRTRLGWRWIAWSGKVILNDRKKVVEMVAYGQDITKRKRTEDALRQSEVRYKSLVENIDLGISVIDSDYRIVMTNGTLHSPHNKVPGDVIGRKCFRRLRGLPAICPDCPGERAMASGRPAEAEMEMVQEDGTHRWLRVHAFPTFGGDGATTGFIGVVKDVTEHKSLEEQLRRAQRMEAIGHLAGGIAHDFGNLLTVINGYGRSALETLDVQSPLHQELDLICEAGQRATSLTRNLLTFASHRAPKARILDLNEVLDGMGEMLRRLIDESVRIKMNLCKGLGSVKIDPGRIEQVVLNLAVNARDAMPGGGVLTLETANVVLDETDTPGHLSIKQGAYILLAVTDTGSGMSAQVKKHLFEPFFTTKDPIKGTGLGLATIHGIIKESGGDIRVESELGQGTTFKIYLPQVSEAPEKLKSDVAAGAPPRGHETILVVEDQHYVREFSAYTLRRLGYTVLEAPYGTEALELVQAHEEPIDLVLTDMVMPHMSGRELIGELGKMRRGFGVLYMSGYSDSGVGSIHFIAKPFTMELLARKVREALDTR